jgi:mitochondrial fission protein ELM1
MKKKAWLVTDGTPGMESQTWGLAEALGYTVIKRPIRLRPFWKLFAPYLRIGKKWSFKFFDQDLNLHSPDLIIGCGRQSVLPALYLKKVTKAKTIYIQDPKVPSHQFDLIISPFHDTLAGSNVIKMHGSFHHITTERLCEARKHSSWLESFKSPRLVFFLGGPNGTYDLTVCLAKDIVRRLKDIKDHNSCSLLVTPSRRTPLDVVEYFKQSFEKDPDVHFWNQTGDNPYFAFLAYGDAFLVTCDSVNMISEASTTTKPVYLIKLPGGSRKFRTFHDHMVQTSRVHFLNEDIQINWTEVSPMDENERVANEVRKRLFPEQD